MWARYCDIITLGKRNKPMRRESPRSTLRLDSAISASRVGPIRDENTFAVQADVQTNHNANKFFVSQTNLKTLNAIFSRKYMFSKF